MKFMISIILAAVLPLTAKASFFIPDKSITINKMGTPNAANSSDTGTFSTTSTSYVDITGTPVTISTLGLRPILLNLNATASFTECIVQYSGAASAQADVALLVDGLLYKFSTVTTGAMSASSISQIMPGAFTYLIYPALTAGSHTFKLQVKVQSGTTFTMQHCQLTALEL